MYAALVLNLFAFIFIGQIDLFAAATLRLKESWGRLLPRSYAIVGSSFVSMWLARRLPRVTSARHPHFCHGEASLSFI